MDHEPQPTGSGPAPVSRSTEGRWLGGVCRGVGEARGISTGWLRVAVLALTMCGGLGAVLYLAAWLILPSRSGQDVHGTRGIVVLAKALSELVGLAILAAAGAAATVFGFGWIVFGVAAATFVTTFSLRRLGPGWALLPLVALTVPAAALAADGVQLAPTDGAHVVRVPAPALALHAGSRTYRSGLGTLLLDLRRTPLPHRGKLVLHIRAGIRRTIVALPSDTCVNVVVHPHVNPFPVRLASLLAGRDDHTFADVFLFGSDDTGWLAPRSSTLVRPRPGPTLEVDFSSEGGSLYVRDYPDHVNPDLDPYWPGFPVIPESRPDTRGLSRTLARREIRSWRARRIRELAAQRRYRSVVGGPCAVARTRTRTSARAKSGPRTARRRQTRTRARRTASKRHAR
jgi:phage shock protein PspC (stress-responsive transcriptional regulator)